MEGNSNVSHVIDIARGKTMYQVELGLVPATRLRGACVTRKSTKFPTAFWVCRHTRFHDV